MLWSSHGTQDWPTCTPPCSSSLSSHSPTLPSQDTPPTKLNPKPRPFFFQSLFPLSGRLHFPRSLCRFHKVADNVNPRYHIQQSTADSTSGTAKTLSWGAIFFLLATYGSSGAPMNGSSLVCCSRGEQEGRGAHAPHPTIFAFTLTHTIKKPQKNTLPLWKAQVFMKASTEPSGLVSSLPTANFAHALVFPLWLDASALLNCCWEKCTF